MKWIIGVIVIAGAGYFLWQSGWLEKAPQPTGQETQETQQATSQSGLPTADNDASDAAIAQDSAAIDAQISGLSNDSASVDQSLNDKPVTQSY